MEFTLLWAALTAAAGLWIGTRLWSGEDKREDFDRLLGAAMSGLIAGRLVAMLAQGQNPFTSPGDFLIVRGGVHTGTAALAAVATLAIMARGDIRQIDRVAPTALLGLAGWHLGCLWRGACLGVATDLPWAWAEPGSAITRHPVEIYAGMGLLLGVFLISRLSAIPVLATGSALFAAATIRLITEPLRLSLTGGPVIWYWAGSIVGLGLIVASLIRRRSDLRESSAAVTLDT